MPSRSSLARVSLPLCQGLVLALSVLCLAAPAQAQAAPQHMLQAVEKAPHHPLGQRMLQTHQVRGIGLPRRQVYARALARSQRPARRLRPPQ